MNYGFTIKEFKRGFFDRDAVMGAMSTQSAKVLSKFGAFVRQRAKSSIRRAPFVNVGTGQIIRGRRKAGVKYAEAVSKPDQPPYSHGEQLLKRFILFAYDRSARSVVIGPAKLNERNRNRDGALATELLEYGGSTVRTNRTGRDYRANYEPRPYMTPAFRIEMQRLPEIWQRVVMK